MQFRCMTMYRYEFNKMNANSRHPIFTALFAMFSKENTLVPFFY